MKRVLVIAVLLFSGWCWSELINSGFEHADMQEWATTIPLQYSNHTGEFESAGVVDVYLEDVHYTIAAAGDEYIYPVEGSWFLGVNSGSLADAEPSTGNLDIYVSRSLTLQQNETVRGYSALYNGDFEVQDTGWAKVVDSVGTEHVLWESVSGGGDYLMYRDWQQWSWTATDAGEYTLQLGISTFGDNRFSTFAYFDGIDTSTSAVPESSTLMFCAVLLLSSLFVRRR